MLDLERISNTLNISRDRLESLIRGAVGMVLVLAISYIGASTLSAFMMSKLMASARDSWTKLAARQTTKATLALGGNTENYRDIVKAIKDRNLFNSDGKFPDEKSPDAKSEEKKTGAFDINAPCSKPSLSIELVGTIYLDGGTSIATVQESGYSESDIYKEGDAIIGSDAANIVKIERNRVIINNGGVKECLELAAAKPKDGGGAFPDAQPSAPPEGGFNNGQGGGDGGEQAGNDCLLEEKYVQDELGPGFGTIIQKARLVPNVVDNVMNGFKIFAIDSASLLGKTGLKNGDIITGVNDTSLKQPEQGFALYQAFQDEKEVRINILRGGTPMTITCRIK